MQRLLERKEERLKAQMVQYDASPCSVPVLLTLSLGEC